MKTKTCPNCNREFLPNWPTRVYCCDECAEEWKRKRRAAIHAEVNAVKQ